MKRHLLNSLVCLGSMMALCMHSTPVEAIFASVKATGMAAACISHPLDSLAGAYNPAGIGDVGDRFDLEGGWLRDRGHTHVKGNILLDPVTHQPVIGPDGLPVLNPVTNGKFNGMRTKDVFPVGFGLNKVWCFGCDWHLATGIILYNRNYQKTTYKHPLPLLGTTKAGLEYINETISPIVAITWCNSHTLGISANYQIERIKVNGLEQFDRPVFPGIPGGSLFPGHVTNRGYGWSTGWGVTIGYLGHITDCLTIGLTYQPETSMRRIDRYKGFLAQRGKLNIPQKIGAGISYYIMPCLVVAFDVEHIQWSKIKALHNPLLSDGTLQPLGASNGPGFGFKDQWYYRFGVEWEVDDCWTLRAGYRFANAPIRRNQTAVNLLTLDTVESFATVGATWYVTECNELSIMGAYGFENTIKGKNSIPNFLGAGEVDLTESKYAIGLAWGYRF